MPTLAELVKLNDQRITDVEGFSDVVEASDLLMRMEAVPASNGTDHKYLKQTGLSSTTFRDPNTGVTKTVSTDTMVSLSLKIWDASFDADVALAKGYRKGVDAYLNREAKRSVEGAMYALESQVVAGTDTGGFSGLSADTSMVVVASNGATGDTGDPIVLATDTGQVQSQTYLIRSAENGVAVVVGNDGNIEVDAEDPTVVQITDTNGSYPAYYVPALGWAGLQQGGKYDIAKITTSTDLPLTDDLIADAEAKFKAGRKPNLIVGGATPKKQLRASRTATNPTGAPAPIVTESFGIPFVETEAL